MPDPPLLTYEYAIPVPGNNVSLYRLVFALEHWLRRITWATVLALDGANWRGGLPDGLAATLRARSAAAKGRDYLATENEANAIWMMTLDEIARVVASDRARPVVCRMTGMPRDVLAVKLDEFRELRNIIAHNRAVSSETLTIFHGLAQSLLSAIRTFGGQFSEASFGFDSVDARIDALLEERKMRFPEHVWTWSQDDIMIGQSAHFYMLLLPGGDSRRTPSGDVEGKKAGDYISTWSGRLRNSTESLVRFWR